MAMFPIRCVVESVGDSQCCQCSTSGTVVADSYAIVSGQTPLNQLVDTVLSALGLPHLTFGAKGTIQLKNWKPLTFDQISEEPDIDVETILKDVSNHLTLRILTKQSENAMNDCMRDIKDRFLKILVQKLPNFLLEIPSAQLKDFIFQLVQGENGQTVDVQDVHLFNLWLDEWSKKKTNNAAGVAANVTTPASAVVGNHQQQASSSSMVASSSSSAGSSTGTVLPPATRFSQLLEVPKLDRWFRETANPSRQKLLHYMNVLNGSNFRKHTTKISYQQICNWFSNARASQRKRQMRSGGGTTVVPVVTNGGNSNMAAAAAAAVAAAAAATNGGASAWPSKVFGNQVRGLSLAFNDFIQSSGLAQGIHGGGIMSNQNDDSPTGSSPQNNLLTADQQHDQKQQDCQSPSPISDVSIKMEPYMHGVNGHDESSDMPVDGLKFDDNETGMDAQDESESSSPTLAAISAASKTGVLNVSGGGSSCSPAQNDGSPNSSATNRNALLQSSYATLNPANRTRLMFDPLSELPMLEKYFEENPHPSWVQIDQITEALNAMVYRQTYPPVSSHNVKIWFKNRRAKCKRQVIVADNGRS